MKKYVKVISLGILLVVCNVVLSLFFAYLWSKGTYMMRMTKKTDYLLQSSEGSPLVGAREDKNETNVVVWKQGKRLMVITLKEDGAIEWNMTSSDGSEVFDWNGDGLIDERLIIERFAQIRQIRIAEKFYNLEVQNNHPYANNLAVEKKDGEWRFVDQ